MSPRHAPPTGRELSRDTLSSPRSNRRTHQSVTSARRHSSRRAPASSMGTASKSLVNSGSSNRSISFWCRAIPNERTATRAPLPEGPGPRRWGVAVDDLPDRPEKSPQGRTSGCPRLVPVVAAHLEAARQHGNHPLDEQPLGLDGVVEGNEVAGDGVSASGAGHPRRASGHAHALNLYPSKPAPGHRDQCSPDATNAGAGVNLQSGPTAARIPARPPAGRGAGVRSLVTDD